MSTSLRQEFIDYINLHPLGEMTADNFTTLVKLWLEQNADVECGELKGLEGGETETTYTLKDNQFFG